MYAVIMYAAALVMGPLEPTYQLVLDHRGEQYVMDYNMSLGDCFDMLLAHRNSNDARWACELEDMSYHG